MRKLFTAVAVLALATVGTAFADQGAGHEGPKNVSVQGEIVDLGCYLGSGAQGAGHQSCALNCIKNGMPMGLLTADGLFLLTINHDDADPYKAAKKWAAATVKITGPIHDKDGMKSIEVVTATKVDAQEATN